MRLWARPGVWINLSFRFSRAINSTPDTPADKALCLLIHPFSRQYDFRVPNNSKEKTTLSRASDCVTNFHHVTIHYPRPGWRILTPLPVKTKDKVLMHKHQFLGSANPCPSAVHMEPFSTSIFKISIWIIATTTKICNRGCFTQVFTRSCTANPHALLHTDAQGLHHWLGISHPLQRHPFSGLVHSAGELLHTP